MELLRASVPHAAKLAMNEREPLHAFTFIIHASRGDRRHLLNYSTPHSLVYIICSINIKHIASRTYLIRDGDGSLLRWCVGCSLPGSLWHVVLLLGCWRSCVDPAGRRSTGRLLPRSGSLKHPRSTAVWCVPFSTDQIISKLWCARVLCGVPHTRLVREGYGYLRTCRCFPRCTHFSFGGAENPV